MNIGRATRPQVRLRPARADEGQALSDLAFSAKAALGYAPAQMARWRDALRIDPTAGSTWVAEVGGETVGVVAWVIDGASAELTDLWVHPGHQRAGVGSQMLAMAAGHLRQLGLHRVHIDAEPSAAGFYQRLGARHIGAVPAPIEGDPGRQRPQFLWDAGVPPAA